MEHRVTDKEFEHDAHWAEEQEGAFLAQEEAWNYLGVKGPQFEALMKTYGVGRYHLPDRDDQVFYSMRDLDHVISLMPSSKA